MYQINADLLRTNVFVKKHILGIADSFGIEGEKQSPQMTSIKKKKKHGREKAAITGGW